MAHLVRKKTSNALVTLVAAKENCFPFKAIKAIKAVQIFLSVPEEHFIHYSACHVVCLKKL